MSLKALIFLAPVAPVALGGWYLANREAAPGGARLSTGECVALKRRLADELYAGPQIDNATARRRMREIVMELRGHGCPPGLGEPIDFGRTVRPESGRDPREDSSRLRVINPPNGSPNQGVSFEPGQPMVDVSRGHSR